MALGNSDIWLAATTLLGAAVGLLAAGRFVGRRATERRIAGALAGAVAALLVFAMAGTDRLFWAQLAPYSGVVVWGNALLPGVAFAAGLLLSPSLKAIHGPRQRLIAGSLLLCGVAQAVRPFLGDVRRTSDVPVALWQSAVCPQTSEATCSAASAATLLAANDIPATETEMARLCLTRPEGTLMLGAYRGLRLKTVGTSRTVRIFGNISVAELREATHKNPVLISVGIDVWQRGRIDPRYESLWGWTPGKRHAVVLFGFLPNGNSTSATRRSGASSGVRKP